MAGDTLGDVGKGFLDVWTFGQSDAVIEAAGGESLTKKTAQNVLLPKAVPVETPPPAPTPDDPAAKAAMEAQRVNEQRQRGRASTYLTNGRDLGQGNLFKRALLGN